MICSIHDRDLPQLINYMLPIVSKQGYALGLFFIANNATLVKLQKKKKKIENRQVIFISRKSMPLSKNLMAWIAQVLIRCKNEIKRNIVAL